MIVGLDVGTSAVRTLFRLGDTLRGRFSRNVYAVVEDTPTHRKLLTQSQLRFAVCASHLVIFGQAADELAKLMQVPLRPILPDGRIPEADPLARQLLATQLEACLPPGDGRTSLCGYIGPTETAGACPFISQVLRLRGYRPLPLSHSQAAALAELSHSGFTGLVLNFGASRCSAGFCLQGQELSQSTIAGGSDWIDEHFARYTDTFCWDAQGHQMLDTERVARWKQSRKPSLMEPENPEASLLLQLTRELVERVLTVSAARLADEDWIAQVTSPITLLVTGGMAQMPGFCDLVEDVLRQTAFPLDVHRLQLASAGPYTISRGGLIRACLEAMPAAAPRAA